MERDLLRMYCIKRMRVAEHKEENALPRKKTNEYNVTFEKRFKKENTLLKIQLTSGQNSLISGKTEDSKLNN